MKIIFLVLSCCLFSLNILGQAESNDNQTPPAEAAGVEEISLSKDDGAGKAGEVVTEFNVKDVPIHCSIKLASVKAVNVKMNLVALGTGKSETNVVTVNYKTNGKQSSVNFTAAPQEKTWAGGKYRIDIFLDEKLTKSQEFEIKKSAADEKAEKSELPAPAPKPKPKTARRPGKAKTD